MRHRAPVAGLLLALVGTCSVLCGTPPQWSRRAGLDFWNHAQTVAWVRAEEARDRDLDTEIDQQRLRDAAYDQIALGVCECRISMRDAIGDMTALTKSAPGWWAGLRDQYRFAGIPATASDQEVVTVLLRRRIELLLTRAQKAGDTDRASLVTACLACFDDEIQELREERTVAQAKP